MADFSHWDDVDLKFIPSLLERLHGNARKGRIAVYLNLIFKEIADEARFALLDKIDLGLSGLECDFD